MRKEEIRHDPVRENIVKGVEYIKENQNMVLKIFACFVILVTVISYYNHIVSVKIGNASDIAGLAQNTFINGDIDEALVKFERVMEDYPNTSGATQSLVYLLNEAVSKEDHEIMKNIISKYKSDIDDPLVQGAIYKIQGDIALQEDRVEDALSYYRKAENISRATSIHVKYQLDIITTLISKEKYSVAKKILGKILDIEDVGFNEKNKAEELLAFVNHKLGI